jgi:hypothetical protein
MSEAPNNAKQRTAHVVTPLASEAIGARRPRTAADRER